MGSIPGTLGLLLLLIPWAQATQCAPDVSPQLRFVAQLNVSGCALFVHDTGANDGPHLAVEPVMCVTESLHKVAPQYDPVTQQTYVSVPVTLRDDAMLAEVQRQLRHLSPKSVKFATVSDISVSTAASSEFQALRFDWNPANPIGFLEMGCESSFDNECACNLLSRFNNSEFVALDYVLLTASIITNSTTSQLSYRPLLQNRTLKEIDIVGRLPKCQQLRFVRSVRFNNCTARVHQILGMKGHFLIEPLLCHNITSLSNESVMYECSRDMHYLKLDVVLQDDMALDAVMTQLADLSPRSVAFMRLWRAQSHVASALSRRFVIGPLMVSGDWRSAQLRVFCRTEDECVRLRSAIQAGPANLWKHIEFSVTSLLPFRCLMKSEFPRHPWSMQNSGRNLIDLGDSVCKGAANRTCPFGLRWKSISATIASQGTGHIAEPTTRSEAETTNSPKAEPTASAPPDSARRLVLTRGHRQFVVIQQRLTGNVSFQRPWAEYESGFGDPSDFWIGLSAIHSLSKNGAALRVEMKLWNGTELHAEYAGFKVGDASTNYRMTYREMLRDRSSISIDAMKTHMGMQFSTMDRDNDGWRGGFCSGDYGGKAGWWFNSCQFSNPNGLYHPLETSHDSYCSWYIGSRFAALREVRLMLQI